MYDSWQDGYYVISSAKGADYRRKFTEIDLDKPDYSTFEVDILYKLRKCVYPIGSKEYTDKMKVVNFLKKKGLDYWKSPIPSGMYGVIMRDIAPKNKADFDYYIREFGIRKGLKKLVISSKIRIFIGENQ